MNWRDVTGVKDITPEDLNDVRCWFRYARTTLEPDPLGSMFRRMLEPFFNKHKKLGKTAGHVIYRLGELVPEHARRHMEIVPNVYLDNWMNAWQEAHENILPVFGRPPQLF